MPSEGYSSITVLDKVFEQGTMVMIEYDRESIADAVATASAVALERDEAQLAQILAKQLAKQCSKTRKKEQLRQRTLNLR